MTGEKHTWDPADRTTPFEHETTAETVQIGSPQPMTDKLVDLDEGERLHLREQNGGSGFKAWAHRNAPAMISELRFLRATMPERPEVKCRVCNGTGRHNDPGTVGREGCIDPAER